jgi:hypothetical protein
MSRLDRHISLVRGKLMLSQFLKGLAWNILGLAAIVWLVILLDRLVQVHVPRQGMLLLVGCGVTVIAGWVYAIWRRPSATQAAVAIDERLALKEKFTTALYVRPLSDPFAVAALRDAEHTAENVSLHKRFPVEVPMLPMVGVAIAMCVVLASLLIPQADLFHLEASRQKKLEAVHHDRAQAEKAMKEALVQLDSAPKAVADSEQIKLARQDLADALRRPVDDPVAAQKKAENALQEMESIKQQIKDQAKYADAQNAMKALQSLPKPSDESGPIADAQDALSRGDLSQAVQSLESAVDNFDKKPAEEQKKTAQQMAKLASQIAQNASDPKVQQNIQNQLQQMGANAQQAQAISQMMQAAANGDKNAQQQIQKAASQLAQQMNQKQPGASQAQQQKMAQQMQQSMQQMQAQANGQAQSQQLAMAAQQLAAAMQQASQAQSGNKQGQSQSQTGQSVQAQAQQQMSQAGQSMQQQLQQMQAMANAAQSNGAGQGGKSPGQSPGQQASAGQPGSGQGGNQSGQGQQWAKGNQQPGNGGNGGQAGGARPDPTEAPYAVKKELSPSETIDKGRILASSFVKAGTIVGESKVGLSDAVLQEQQDEADQVDEDRIPRASAEAVKSYFKTIQDDSK